MVDALLGMVLDVALVAVRFGLEAAVMGVVPVVAFAAIGAGLCRPHADLAARPDVALDEAPAPGAEGNG